MSNYVVKLIRSSREKYEMPHSCVISHDNGPRRVDLIFEPHRQ